MTTTTKTVIVRTHDPVTGERTNTVIPDDAPEGAKILDALKKMAFGDAVEATWTGGTAVKVHPMVRTNAAAIRIAADMARDGHIAPGRALTRLTLGEFEKLQVRSLTNASQLTMVGQGLAAANGAVTGAIATSAHEASTMLASGVKSVVLHVEKTTPDDMTVLKNVSAIVCTTGGYTSHSAVVARQLGKPCIVSYGALTDEVLAAADIVTVDGTLGRVYTGDAVFQEATLDEHVTYLLSQTDTVAKLKVLTNADTAADYQKAVDWGAKGIGLCRTEHTFFTTAGAQAIQKVIFAKTPKEKTHALGAFYEVQYAHFRELFMTVKSADETITVRLLDPPLHEFLPNLADKAAVKAAAKNCKITQGEFIARAKKLHESNPMLGHRGCRLGITSPTIYEQQFKALFNAARNVTLYGGISQFQLDVMIPLINSVQEARVFHNMYVEAKSDSLYGPVFSVNKARFGVMLETPRACLQSYELAEFCDFFSFGTNDLTQATWMLSRDDSATFLPTYVEKEIENDPFMSLDMDGVGRLMAIAIEGLAERRDKVKIGICGEHGGDPRSIAFCHALGLDYVSCSPPRVQLARLAAAHANLSTDFDAPMEEKTFHIHELSNDAPPIPGEDHVAAPAVVATEAIIPVTEAIIPVTEAIIPVKPAVVATEAVTLVGFGLATTPKSLVLKSAPEPTGVPELPTTWGKDTSKPAEVVQAAASVPSSLWKTPDGGAPSWFLNSPPLAPALVAELKNKPSLAAMKAAAGFRISIKAHPDKTKETPSWGVVVGIAEMTHLSLYVVAVDHKFGHDGKAMKDWVKFEINVKGSAPLWFVSAADVMLYPEAAA